MFVVGNQWHGVDTSSTAPVPEHQRYTYANKEGTRRLLNTSRIPWPFNSCEVEAHDDDRMRRTGRTAPLAMRSATQRSLVFQQSPRNSHPVRGHLRAIQGPGARSTRGLSARDPEPSPDRWPAGRASPRVCDGDLRRLALRSNSASISHRAARSPSPRVVGRQGDVKWSAVVRSIPRRSSRHKSRSPSSGSAGASAFGQRAR